MEKNSRIPYGHHQVLNLMDQAKNHRLVDFDTEVRKATYSQRVAADRAIPT